MRVIVNEKYVFRLLLADMQGANVVCGSARQYKLIIVNVKIFFACTITTEVRKWRQERSTRN